MSWLPVYNCWLFMIGLLGIFLWKLWGVLVLLLLTLAAVVGLIKEVALVRNHYGFGFWLFILSEVIIFATLFVIVCWTTDLQIAPISEGLELPLLGSCILLGSSVTATAYHHSRGLQGSSLYVWLTVVLGLSFVLLQLSELYDCECDILGGVYHAVSFSTVGLHFLHVFIGVVVFLLLLWIGANSINPHLSNLAVWYWHFVDYIWVFVFVFIYLL
uniref:cytochrome c oxidase subunit III n=1 Tax=Carassotrema koreanum TaxID=2573094 RepID=UPI002176E456|nr:cytochrome c oxidase subunit III [Carassotrema koreanum]UUF91996.1 cytochrome c oxidase subunit III [Carassotrema koreanum]